MSLGTVTAQARGTQPAYFTCVRRLVSILLSLLSLASARGESTVLSLESSGDLTARISLRCALSNGTLRLFCAWQDCASTAGGPEAALPTLALSSPWLIFGPVSPMGLLREASNPLGFSPRSDVFVERTGLLLDGSLPPGSPGFLCMPLPDVFGLFCLPCARGALAYGCFVNIQPAAECRAECFLTLTESRPESLGEEWFSASPANPGGVVMVTGARLLLDFPGLSLGMTFGGSQSERSPPGSFCHLRGSWHGDGLFAEAILGSADRTYRRPGGMGSEGVSALSGSVGIEQSSGSAKISYSLSFAQPGFAPRPLRASREVMGIALEQDFAAAAGLDLSCRAEAEKRMTRVPSGDRQETGRCAASLKGRIGGFEAGTRVEVNDPGGIDISLSGGFPLAGGGPRLFLEARMERVASACPVLTALLALHLERKDSTLMIESGIDGCSLRAGASDAMKHFRLKVSWSVRRVLGK
jgi:hypothetical protein